MTRPIVHLLLALLSFSSAIHADDSFYDIPAPGKLIDIGGYRMHINCQGTGSPTVVLDAGLGDWSTHWAAVQPLIKTDTRVCSYDRAGYGWSDPGPRPRTSPQIVGELHSLLEKAGEHPPYLLVGHSFGGINMRLFGSTYPQETTGLILVDASHPASLPYRLNEAGDAPSLAALNNLMIMQSNKVEIRNVPPEAAPVINNNWFHTKSVATSRSEYRGLNLSVNSVLTAPSLGNLDLVVISRGLREWPSGEDGDKHEQAWQQQQQELIKLSTSGHQTIAAKSGHYIQMDEPELVAGVIREMVLAERKKLAYIQPPADQ